MQSLGSGLSRSRFLRRGAGAAALLIVSASGLGAFAPAAFADTSPAGDLAYLRLLIAAELLAVDFYGQALERAIEAGRALSRGRFVPTSRALHTPRCAARRQPADARDGRRHRLLVPAARSQAAGSVVRFARELERVLVGAYIDALEHVQTPAYRETMARILASETQHHCALAALAEPRDLEAVPSPVRDGRDVRTSSTRYES